MSERLTERDYREQIKLMAECVLTEYDALADVYDAIHEQCDQHEWVIYTYRAYQVCALECPDWSEYEDDLGEPPRSIEALACWQMIKDVTERVQEMQGEAKEGAK